MLIAVDGFRVRLEIRRGLGGDHGREARQVLGYRRREKLADALADDPLTGDAGVARIGVVHFQDAPIRGFALLIKEQFVKREAFRHVLEEQTILLLARAQRLLGLFVLGDVVHHPHGADDLAALVAEVFAFFADDADLAGRPLDDPVLDFVAVLAVPNRAGIGGVNSGAVVRVNGLEEGLVCRAELLRLQAEDAVHLVGPGQPVGHQVELPTAEMGDLLRPLQPILALAQATSICLRSVMSATVPTKLVATRFLRRPQTTRCAMPHRPASDR